MSAFDSGKKVVAGDIAHGSTDSSSTSYPVKVGGIAYNFAASPTAVDNGDRVQAWYDQYGRQVVLPAPRYSHSFGYKEEPVTYAVDVTVSTTNPRGNGVYAVPDAAFYDGSDAGFGASARYIKYQLAVNNEQAGNMTNPFMGLYNGLGVSCTVVLYGVVAYTYSSAAFPNLVQLDSVTVANTGSCYFIPFEAGGTPGAGVYSVPAMNGPWEALILGITPASDPSTGYIRFWASKTN